MGADRSYPNRHSSGGSIREDISQDLDEDGPSRWQLLEKSYTIYNASLVDLTLLDQLECQQQAASACRRAAESAVRGVDGSFEWLP